jgi:hypothetical protein
MKTVKMKKEKPDKIDRDDKIITGIGIAAGVGLVLLFVFYYLLTHGIIDLTKW